MAMRRPRIKPVANIQLNNKRKKAISDNKNLKDNTWTTNENDINNQNGNSKQSIIDNTQHTEVVTECTEQENKVIPKLECNIKNEREQEFIHNDDIVPLTMELSKINSSITNNDLTVEVVQNSLDGDTSDEINAVIIKNDYNVQEVDVPAFKYPPKVDNNRPMVNGTDDVFYSDLEDNNLLQMDLQKFNSCYPMSPTKTQARQRIRVTPIFGQRRNSFIISPTHASSYNCQHEDIANNNNNTNNNTNMEHSNLVNQRRERHLSGSAGTVGNLQARQLNPTTTSARIRTDSSCSAMSEGTFSHGHKPRKSDDQYHYRQHCKRDFENRFNNGVPDKSLLKMFDLIYYNPNTNPIQDKSQNNSSVKHEVNSGPCTKAQVDVKTDLAQEDVKFGVTQETSDVTKVKEATCNAAVPVPQLKLNANGELILDDKSLVIETTADQEARKTLANTELIYLDEYTGMNGFYKRQKRTREWFADETIKFYRCLQTIGTDFSLMVSLFPNRTRRDLKLKFKKEERINSALINKALLYPKQFNIEELKRQIDAEEEEQKARKSQQLLCKYKATKRTKKKPFVSAAQRLLEQGDENIYDHETVKKLIKRPRGNKQKRLLIMEENKESRSNLDLHKHLEFVDSQEVETFEEWLKVTDKDIKQEQDDKQKKHLQIKNENEDGFHNINQTITVRSIPKSASQPAPLKNKPLKKSITKRKVHCRESPSVNDLPLLQKEEDNEIEMQLNNLLQNGLNETAYITINNNDEKVTFASEEVWSNVPLLYEDHNIIAEFKCLQNTEEENLKPIPIPEFETTSSVSAQWTITNLDDGTIVSIDETNGVTDLLDENNASSSPVKEDVEEEAIQKIINELSEGSLVLVSTFDPDNENNVIHEIYKMNKHTDELEDEPLNLPDYIIKGISSLINKS